MMNFLRALFGSDPRSRDTRWHKFYPKRPFIKLIDGSRSIASGQMWRRWNGVRWEYKQDPETEEEWGDRIW